MCWGWWCSPAQRLLQEGKHKAGGEGRGHSCQNGARQVFKISSVVSYLLTTVKLAVFVHKKNWGTLCWSKKFLAQNVAIDVQRGSQASPKLLFICDHEHFAEGREGGRKGGVKVNPRRGGRTPNGYHCYHCYVIIVIVNNDNIVIIVTSGRQELFTLRGATTDPWQATFLLLTQPSSKLLQCSNGFHCSNAMHWCLML